MFNHITRTPSDEMSLELLAADESHFARQCEDAAAEEDARRGASDARTFLCSVRLTREGQLVIVSPKTGRTAYARSGAVPQRIRGKIVQAVSIGGHAVTLSVGELRAFAAVAVLPSPAPIVTPQPASVREPSPGLLWGGWRGRRQFRRR